MEVWEVRIFFNLTDFGYHIFHELLNTLTTFEYAKLFSKVGFKELDSREVCKKHKVTFFKKYHETFSREIQSVNFDQVKK